MKNIKKTNLVGSPRDIDISVFVDYLKVIGEWLWALTTKEQDAVRQIPNPSGTASWTGSQGSSGLIE